MKKIYIGTLYRFGYDLTVVCKTRQDCIDKLLEKYLEIYKSRNDDDPMEEIAYDHYSDKTYYETAKEDIEIREYTLDKAEWC